MKLRETWSPIFAQASVTHKEILRGGTMIGIIGVWLLLLLTATAFGTVSIGERIYVIKDFGLFLSSIATVFITVGAGSSLLAKEIKQKNIYTILSKPIGRFQYLSGKLVGIWLACTGLNIVLHFCLVGYVFLLEGIWSPELLLASLYVSFESLILATLCLLIASIFVTPMLVGVICFLLFVIGRNLEVVLSLIQGAFLRNLSNAFPHLYRLHIGNELPYGIYPNWEYCGIAALYTISYVTICFIITGLIFSRRNFS